MNYQLHHFSKRLKKCEQVRRKNLHHSLDHNVILLCFHYLLLDHRHSSPSCAAGLAAILMPSRVFILKQQQKIDLSFAARLLQILCQV